MLTVTRDQLHAVLLARGADPRPFTKALWVTEKHIMCTNGQRMHLLWHGQEWAHGNVAIPLSAVLSAEAHALGCTTIGPRTINARPFLPVMGASLPDVDRYLPKLPTTPWVDVQRCSISGRYLLDAQEAIALMIEGEQDDCLHRTNENTWTWCNGKFLVCVATLKNNGHKYQLKGFE